MSEEWIINSDQSKQAFMSHIENVYDQHKYVKFKVSTGKQRTNAQNAALHLWLGQVSKVLNDAGLDMKKVIKPEIDIPWTTVSAKEYLWRPIQEAILNKASTTEADRKEYTEVYEVLNRHLAGKLGIQVPPWPSKD